MGTRPASSCTNVNVGLVTSTPAGTPSARHNARVKNVLPGAEIARQNEHVGRGEERGERPRHANGGTTGRELQDQGAHLDLYYADRARDGVLARKPAGRGGP